MGTRAGQGYGHAKPKRLTCPQCGKKGVKQWYASAGSLYRDCQYCLHTWGELSWQIARQAQEPKAALFPQALKPSLRDRPLTPQQLALLKTLALVQTVGEGTGWLRLRPRQTLSARGLELRGLVQRSDAGGCRLTPAGRDFLAASQPRAAAAQ